MLIVKYTSYILILGTYVFLTKSIFLKVYRRLQGYSFYHVPRQSTAYKPIKYHWFYKEIVKSRNPIWKPFSLIDSNALEKRFQSDKIKEKIVKTDGGRFDVDIEARERSPVYWYTPPAEVRRCLWFYRTPDERKLIPFSEEFAEELEEEYRLLFERRRSRSILTMPCGDSILLENSENFLLKHNTQVMSGLIKRGTDEFTIHLGEESQIDHLILVVHGIGSACDLRFRSLEEVVERFRDCAADLLDSHNVYNDNRTHRVEVLPIMWHSFLHSDSTDIDNILKNITLESMPFLRNFTNNTLLDILFYTSPVYQQGNSENLSTEYSTEENITYTTRVPFAQIILNAVGIELNRIFSLFEKRNPKFNGRVSLVGHSLGSVIIFDLLCHQPYPSCHSTSDEFSEADDYTSMSEENNRINFMMFQEKTGDPLLHYPILNFHPLVFFALGSPIGAFLTVRGIRKLGNEFSLPTCPSFFNIFHPNDPIAYRVESLINKHLEKLKPVMVPYYKGRKRMHLEFKETLSIISTKFKNLAVRHLKSLCNIVAVSLLSISISQSKAIENYDTPTESIESNASQDATIINGRLNQGRRIDYVLQETAIEYLNEYLFALTSHVCYWDSPDTILMILEELHRQTDIMYSKETFTQTKTTTDISSDASFTKNVPELSSNSFLALHMSLSHTVFVTK